MKNRALLQLVNAATSAADNLVQPVGLTSGAPDELTQIIAFSASVRIERIVSRGHASPPGFWYDQDEAEWVAVLTGEALLRWQHDDSCQRLKPGDHVHIPPHAKHRVDWTAPDVETVWLAVFYK